MSDVFYLRPIDPPATLEAVFESAKYSGGCFDLHRVAWVHSFLVDGGRQLLCRYRAPDAESTRLALRELGADLSAVWPGRVIGGVEPDGETLSRVAVLVELPLNESAPGDDGELLRQLGSTSGNRGSATFLFGFVSNRRERMVCLFRGDAESARSSLEQAGFPAATAWPCAVVTPRAR